MFGGQRRKDETVVLKLQLPNIQRQALQLASFFESKKTKKADPGRKKRFSVEIQLWFTVPFSNKGVFDMRDPELLRYKELSPYANSGSLTREQFLFQETRFEGEM